jgi:hypothetical protein
MLCKSVVALYDNYRTERILLSELSALESLHRGLDGCDNSKSAILNRYGSTRKYSNSKSKNEVDKNNDMNNVKKFLNKKKTSLICCDSEIESRGIRKVSFQMENIGDTSDAVKVDTKVESYAEKTIVDSKERTLAANISDCADVSGAIGKSGIKGGRTNLKIDRSDHNTNGIDTNDYIATINSIKNDDTMNNINDKKIKGTKKSTIANDNKASQSSRIKNGQEYKESSSNIQADCDPSFQIVNNDGDQSDNSDEYINDDEASQYLRGIIDSESEEEKEDLIHDVKESSANDVDKKKIALIGKYDDSINGDDIDSNSTYDDSFECIKMDQISVLHRMKNGLYWRIFKVRFECQYCIYHSIEVVAFVVERFHYG